MATRILRQVVRIDEAKCDGCGACVPACAEGALQVIDGKARLVSERYCDGLGACLGECPRGAITIEEREAEEFDEALAGEHLQHEVEAGEALPCGCPSATVAQFHPAVAQKEAVPQESALGHWPVQLTLVPAGAPFLKGADILLAADCVPFAYAGFHGDYLAGRALLVACPKLDDFGAHLQKLTAILKEARPKSLTVVRMEVPCCGGLAYMARQAIRASGQDLPLKEVVIGVRGDIKSQ